MAADPHFASVKLLLRFIGPNGGLVLTDNSPTPATVTANNGAALSTARAVSGGVASSLFLDGTNDHVTTNRACTASGQFTVEAWVRPHGSSPTQPFCMSSQHAVSTNAYFIVTVDPAGVAGVYLRNAANGGAFSLASSAGAVAVNDTGWYHIAATRNAANLVTLWVNGVSVATGTSATDPTGIGTWNIGSQFGAAQFAKSYVGGVRVTEGVCRYTGTFTPQAVFPISKYEITGQVTDSAYAAIARVVRAYRRADGALLGSDYSSAPDPDYGSVVLLLRGNGAHGSQTVVDSSPNPMTVTAVGNAQISTAQYKFGGSSLAFDGAGDYFTVPDSASVEFGAAPFTMECFVRFAAYPTNNGGEYRFSLISKDVAGTNSRGYNFSVSGTSSSLTTLEFTAWSTGNVATAVTQAFAFSLNTWYHVAVSRVGNLLYLFVNGTLLNAGGTAFALTIQDTATTMKIGADVFDGTYFYYLNGFIGELRITKGVGRNTASFTASAEALPAKQIGTLGTYAIPFSADDEVTLLCLDDDAGTLENDLCHRVIPA